MSSIFKKPTSSPRQQELGWLNLVHQSHDQFCHCEDPDLHLLLCLNKFNNWKKPEKDVRNIKCLLTGKTDIPITTTEEKEDLGFDAGDLEQLFAEDGEEPENTTEDPKR